MKTGKIIMFTSLGALGIASLFMMGSSNASFGDFNQRGNSIQSMAEVENYTDLLEKVEGTRMEGKISEEKFNEMKEKHENREENREAIDAAIQNHDYTAWKSLHEGQDVLAIVDTEAKFEKLIEMHSIMEDARANMDTAREKADAIAEELGLERGMGQKLGNKMGEGRGQGMGKGNHEGRGFMMENNN